MINQKDAEERMREKGRGTEGRRKGGGRQWLGQGRRRE